MWTRKELKAKAKVEYKKNPWMSVLASLVLLTLSGALNTYFVKGANNAAIDQGYDSLANALIEGSAQFVIAVLTVMAAALLVGVALRIFVLNPLNASCTNFYVENSKQEKDDTKAIFKGVEKGTWFRLAVAIFMKRLICALWGLLLFVPGVVKGYQYRFVEFLIIENPDMKWNEAMKISKSMTDGQKANIFVLDLSFILWYALAGVPVLGWFVLPYILQTDAELYLALKK